MDLDDEVKEIRICLREISYTLKRIEKGSCCNCEKNEDIGLTEAGGHSWRCPAHGRKYILEG